MTYIITTDSSSDTDRTYLEKRNIKIINYKYEIAGKLYEDDDGKSLSYDEFYTSLSNGSSAKTSAINSLEYADFFTPILEEGFDIVHVMLSSGLSSSYENAMITKRELEKEYSGRKIYIIDSLTASSGLGLLLDKLADLRNKGYSSEEVFEWAEENKGRINAWFCATDLAHYVRGGRLSAPVGWIGGKLNICPLMTIDKDGRVEIDQVIRSKKKARNMLIKKFETTAIKDDKIVVIDGMMAEDKDAIYSYIVEKYPETKDDLSKNRIGTTIGAHTGSETFGIIFWSEKNSWEY